MPLDFETQRLIAEEVRRAVDAAISARSVTADQVQEIVDRSRVDVSGPRVSGSPERGFVVSADPDLGYGTGAAAIGDGGGGEDPGGGGGGGDIPVEELVAGYVIVNSVRKYGTFHVPGGLTDPP